MDQTAIRVLLVDDDLFVRTVLSEQLNNHLGIEVVRTCADGADALSATAELTPDVILMDIRMPLMDGISATAAIVERDADAVVLAMTSLGDEASVDAMLAAGAKGYLLKTTSIAVMAQAIRSAAAGLAVLSAAALHRPATDPHDQRTAADLTERERQILAALSRGRTNAQVAEAAYISLSSVKRAVADLMRKFEVTTRVELLMKARKLGLDRQTPRL